MIYNLGFAYIHKLMIKSYIGLLLLIKDILYAKA